MCVLTGEYIINILYKKVRSLPESKRDQWWNSIRETRNLSTEVMLLIISFSFPLAEFQYCQHRSPILELIVNYSLANQTLTTSYVYWTVHHLDSWIKIDQLEVTCFIISLFTAQHVSNVSTFIFSSLRLIVDLSCGLYCSGSMCVGVTVWFGWGGVVSLCRLKH